MTYWKTNNPVKLDMYKVQVLAGLQKLVVCLFHWEVEKSPFVYHQTEK